MPKSSSVLDLPLSARPAGRTLSRWLYEGLRAAILDGRLDLPRRQTQDSRTNGEPP
jgi:hypothetical protein